MCDHDDDDVVVLQYALLWCHPIFSFDRTEFVQTITIDENHNYCSMMLILHMDRYINILIESERSITRQICIVLWGEKIGTFEMIIDKFVEWNTVKEYYLAACEGM